MGRIHTRRTRTTTKGRAKMSVSITQDEAEAITKVLGHLDEIRMLLAPHEAWVNFPISIDTEIADGIQGKLDLHDPSGALVFQPDVD